MIILWWCQAWIEHGPQLLTSPRATLYYNNLPEDSPSSTTLITVTSASPTTVSIGHIPKVCNTEYPTYKPSLLRPTLAVWYGMVWWDELKHRYFFHGNIILCHRRGRGLVRISCPLLADVVFTLLATGKSANRVLLAHVQVMLWRESRWRRDRVTAAGAQRTIDWLFFMLATLAVHPVHGPCHVDRASTTELMFCAVKKFAQVWDCKETPKWRCDC